MVGGETDPLHSPHPLLPLTAAGSCAGTCAAEVDEQDGERSQSDEPGERDARLGAGLIRAALQQPANWPPRDPQLWMCLQKGHRRNS
ncbi:hypothetical protein GN956_G16105 [Arapaima gigas]